MIAVLLAAGYGTRLRPLTWKTPKPMLPLCNRPLAGWALESLLAAGIDELIVNLHHLPDPIERFLRETYGHRAAIHFSLEREILGTGGALRRVRDSLARHDEFLLVNGDTIQFPPYEELRRKRRDSDALAALTLRHPPPGDRFTSVWYEDGRVTGFGAGHGQPLMFSGSHAISAALLDRLPDEEVFGIVDRVYQPLLEARQTIAAVVDDGLWFDVGTPERYLAASAGLIEAMAGGAIAVPTGSSLRGSSVVDDTARVSGSLEGSTAGARCIIEGDVRGSIVWEGCAIAPSVRLERCIVADGVELTGPLELRDAVVCREHAGIPPDVPRRDGLVITGRG